MARKALLIFLLFVAIVGVSAMYLPWWGTALVVLGLVVLAAKLIPVFVSRGLSDVMTKLFDTKSRVLRDAQVAVHTVELTERPPVVQDEELDELELDEDTIDPETTKYVLVDATITPGDPTGPMQHWEPGEFRLVGFEHDTSLEALAEGLDEGGDVMHAERLDADGTADDDFDKVVGEHRLRLVFACPRSMTGRAKLQYYFEGIGDFKIPA